MRIADEERRYWVESVKRANARLLEEAPNADILMEPAAPYVEEATVKITGFTQPYWDVKATAAGRISAAYIPVWRELKARKLVTAQFARSGGPVKVIPSKRIRKWIQAMQRGYLTYAYEPWTGDDIRKTGYRKLLHDVHDRIHMNADIASQYPEKLSVGKDPNTGTGWHYPIDTRGNLIEHFDRNKELVLEVIDEYYADMDEAVAHWPEEGSLITVNPVFKGISHGVRSDADVVQAGATEDSLWHELEVKGREVGVTPSSMLMSPALSGATWRRDIWEKYRTPSHVLPFNVQDVLELLYPPPALRSDSEPATISLDAGLSIPPVELIKEGNQRWRLTNDEEFGLGADACVLQGITLRGGGGDIHMLKSGAPETTLGYLVWYGWLVDQKIRENNLNVKFYQLGDDLLMSGPTEELSILLQHLRGIVRNKSTYDNAYFTLGRWWVWDASDPAKVITFISPRVTKTISSVRAGIATNIGEPVHLRPSPEALQGLELMVKTGFAYCAGDIDTVRNTLLEHVTPEELAAMGTVSDSIVRHFAEFQDTPLGSDDGGE